MGEWRSVKSFCGEIMESDQSSSGSSSSSPLSSHPSRPEDWELGHRTIGIIVVIIS